MELPKLKSYYTRFKGHMDWLLASGITGRCRPHRENLKFGSWDAESPEPKKPDEGYVYRADYFQDGHVLLSIVAGWEVPIGYCRRRPDLGAKFIEITTKDGEGFLIEEPPSVEEQKAGGGMEPVRPPVKVWTRGGGCYET